MIKTDVLSFGYTSRRRVLNNISLTLGEGHIHGLLGCNGIGKTTLIKTIMGEFPQTSGEIVRHRDLKIGYIKQNDYDLSGYAFTKDVILVGPNAGVDGNAERVAEANIKMSSATLSANLTIDGVNIIGAGAWTDKGLLLNANAGHLVLENNIISKYITFIQTNASHSASVESSITIEHNKFNTIGQFFVYIQDGKGAGYIARKYSSYPEGRRSA